MSAREDLEALLEFYGVGPIGRQKVQYAVADLLHEEAEKLRRNGCGCRCERTNADLIDPYTRTKWVDIS